MPVSPELDRLDVRVIEVGEVAAREIAKITGAQQRDTLYLLNDRGVDAGQREQKLGGYQHSLISQTRSAHHDHSDQFVTDLNQHGAGGHTTIYRARSCDQSRQVCVRREQKAGTPDKDHPAITHYREISQASPVLVEILAIAEDPRTEDVTEPIDLSVLEWVDGNPLHESVEQMELCDYLSVLIQVLDGLDHVHSNNLVHRDVKPKNILVDQDHTEPRSKIIDPDLYTQVDANTGRRPIREGDLQGTKPFPPELLPNSPLPDAQRYMSGAVDIWKFGNLLAECLSMDIEDGREVLVGPHSALQQKLFTLYLACKSDCPAMRPTAKELRTALLTIQKSRYIEKEAALFRATRAYRKLYHGDGIPTEVRDLYEQVEEVKHSIIEDPAFISMQAHLQTLIAQDRPAAAKEQLLAEATAQYQESWASIPFATTTDEMRNAAATFAKVSDMRAKIPDQPNRDHHTAESLQWGSVSALLAVPPDENDLIMRALETGIASAHVGTILSRLRSIVTSRLAEPESAMQIKRSDLSASLQHVCPDAFRQFATLDPAATMRIRMMLYGAFRNLTLLATQVAENDEEGQQYLQINLITVSDAILLLDPDPPANFWIMRSGLLEGLAAAGVYQNATDVIEEGIEEAIKAGGNDPEMACDLVDLCMRNELPVEAERILICIPEEMRTSDHVLKLVEIRGLEHPDTAVLLRHAYELDPSDPMISEVLIQHAMHRLQSGDPIPVPLFLHGPTLPQCLEKVFCTDPAYASEELGHQIRALTEHGSIGLLDEQTAMEIFHLWRQWDSSHAPLNAFYRIALERGWTEFLRNEIERVRWPEHIPPPAVDQDSPATKLRQELARHTSLDAAAQFVFDQYLPTVLPDVQRCNIIKLSGVKPTLDKITAGSSDSILSEQQRTSLVIEDPSTTYETRNGSSHAVGIPISDPGDGLVLCIEWSSHHDMLNSDLVEILLIAQTLQTIHLQEKERSLMRDIQLARDIQRSTLPGTALELPDDYQIRARMEPFDPVGGDGYYWERLDHHRTAFGIYDVCGHGISASLIQVQLSTAIDLGMQRMRSDPSYTLDQFVRDINLALCAKFDQFASGCFCLHDAQLDEVLFVSTGHPTPILTNGARFTAEVQDHLPLLIMPYDDALTVNRVKLNGGGMILFTDAFLETHPEQAGKAIGLETLQKWIRECSHLSAEDQVAYLFKKLLAFSPLDDSTAVCFAKKVIPVITSDSGMALPTEVMHDKHHLTDHQRQLEHWKIQLDALHRR